MARIAQAFRFASENDCKGITTCMMRAATHLSFCAAQIQAEAEFEAVTIPTDDIVAEIDRAIQQWDMVIRPIYIGDETTGYIRIVSEHFNIVRDSAVASTPENRAEVNNNIMTLMTEIIHLGVPIDRAAFGLRYPEDTDAGREL